MKLGFVVYGIINFLIMEVKSVENDNCEIEETTKEKIERFPREKDWIRDINLFKYQGFWYPESFLEGIMSAQQKFEARSTDILVASSLKTGTTWLKALTFTIATRSTFLDISTSPLLQKLPHDCIPFLEIDLANSMDSSNPNPDNHIPLIATHIPYNSLPKSAVDSGCKIVYIWRDPKDVFVSLWYFFEKIQKSNKSEPPIPLEEALELFCRGISLYGPYWEHVLSYWKVKVEFPERILFLKYEEMKKETRFYVMKLAEFMGYPFSVEEEENGVVEKIIKMCSFENLSELEVNKNGSHRENTNIAMKNNVYFRKGKVGDWENELTPQMAARLDTVTNHKFRASGLLLSEVI
ncbi:flavonol 3-sulfotransferase-like [Euphorbia lathyris]|uniref:flavonol 3-sulfotransferase-like n=1 Tax=Euphorbia lathyris TaxID=212925 RepID=UPI0033143D60